MKTEASYVHDIIDISFQQNFIALLSLLDLPIKKKFS